MEQSSSLRYTIPFFVVSFFLLYFFSSGVHQGLSPSILTKGPGPCPTLSFHLDSSIFVTGLPDFGNYRHVATLSAEQLSLGHRTPFLHDEAANSPYPTDDPDRRAIIVGDIHGMKLALEYAIELLDPLR